jgi:hypothetical protein
MMSGRGGRGYGLALALALACLAPAAWAQRAEPFRIVTHDEGIDREAVRRFFRRVDVALDRVCRDVPGKTAECTVLPTLMELREGMEILSFSDGRLQIYLSGPPEGWMRDRRRLGLMLGALLLHRLELPAVAGYRRLPGWLTSGLLHLLMARLEQGRLPGMVHYPGLYGMVEAGIDYPLDGLLSWPLQPEDGAAYGLQMEAGEVLVLAIMRLPGGRGLLAELAKASTQGQATAEEAFAETVGPVIGRLSRVSDGAAAESGAGMLRQRWFAEAVRQTAVNPFYPASARFAERRFREIEQVSFWPVNSGAGEGAAVPQQACLLEELGERWGEMADPEGVLAGRQRAVSELLVMAPELMRPPLEDLLAACRRLAGGGRRGFARRVAAVRQDFHRRLERQAALERLMREAEASSLTAGERHAAELGVFREGEARRRLLWPSVHELLDDEARGWARGQPAAAATGRGLP